FYFKNEEGMEFVEHYVSNVSPLTRAAFVYMGDFFHLAKYNDKFMRDFIGALITPDVRVDTEGWTDTDWVAAEKTIDGDMQIIISQFRTDVVPMGKAFSDVKKL
ncbi:family B DNA polymerase, partial [Shigella flexneri]|uniref:family B DNA polymerase n=1 Tax=Shigella flexneri TaxID=623 RepID=UPI001C0A92D5